MGLRKTIAPEPLREVAERQPTRDLAGLLGQLHSASAEQRRWAARDLAAHPQAATALGEALPDERDGAVREALFTSLTTLASEAAAAALMPLLRSEDAGLRNGAIEALGSMPTVVAPHVDALLHDADADVRIFTVNLLGDLRHPKVERWLGEVLDRETQVNVVAAAIEVLAEAGSPASVPALQRAMARFDGDAFIGFACQMAIERVQSA